MGEQPIYFDNNASTRLDPSVASAMCEWLVNNYGNASSQTHSAGARVRDMVEQCRLQIAQNINAKTSADITFTSGATESINHAIKGVIMRSRRRKIVAVSTEHSAVLHTCQWLHSRGFVDLEITPVAPDGRIDLNAIDDAIDDDTALVNVMAVNNETGMVSDIRSISRLCKERGAILHTDAVQAIGKRKFDVTTLDVDIASFAAHKIYGPKGIGALYISEAVRSQRKVGSLIHGGGQELGLRSGTLNDAGVVGLAKAIEVCEDVREVESQRIRKLRTKLRNALIARIPDSKINGGQDSELDDGTLNISFLGVDSVTLLLKLQDHGISASPGSACIHSRSNASHVLTAMSLPESRIHSAIRFSIGRFNSLEEVERVVDILEHCVALIRAMVPRGHSDNA